MFEAFYRGQADGHSGSGLGLAIVRGFVEANGGAVRVESLPGQGASFVVEFALPANFWQNWFGSNLGNTRTWPPSWLQPAMPGSEA